VSPRRPLLRGSLGPSGWCQRQRTPTRVRRLLRVVLPRPFFRCFISLKPWSQPRVIFLHPSDPHVAPPVPRVSTSGIRAVFPTIHQQQVLLADSGFLLFFQGGTTPSTTREVLFAAGTSSFFRGRIEFCTFSLTVWKAWRTYSVLTTILL
jgi:hypothetical protein